MNAHKSFIKRLVGPSEAQQAEMLEAIGVSSLDELIEQTIPRDIRLQKPLNLPPPMDEREVLQHVDELARKNVVARSYIGLGYYNTVTPSVIRRNIFENPGWYTQYTPYQSEISQGRLEALLNFQTMVIDLTAMEVANASLLDEATAAAEAMAMLHRLRSKEKVKANADRFFVSDKVFPQTLAVLQTRSEPLGIELVVGNAENFAFTPDVFGALLQFPAEDGAVYDYRSFVERAHQNGALVAVAADLLSLTLMTPPGEFDADVVVGSVQRFGVPLGFGGPHAAYMATRQEFIRQMPGRIIGVSVDRLGNPGYRMALQTREQHIRREKATSNICTAQALLAIMAGMYAVYHGPEGLRAIAEEIHAKAVQLERLLLDLGWRQLNEAYFDTLKVKGTNELAAIVRRLAAEKLINLRCIDDETFGISIDETTTEQDIRDIAGLFAEALGRSLPDQPAASVGERIPAALRRRSAYLQHPVFNIYRSETAMMRYIKTLENKDLSLTQSMIPLGSCTMKLNPATAMLPLSRPEFAEIHPFAPEEQTEGYRTLIRELEKYLTEITGFAAASVQPNSGAQGEYTGLMVIRAYLKDRGQGHRRVTLIPASAHGTNPASAAMAGMTIVVVDCDEHGNIDLNDLRAKAEQYKNELAALMVTYPSTHGVFEEQIREICRIVHEYGGQVYMDGANMNAQVGLTSPAAIGADICHLNLHKTFAIPHGGGGPGVGPICAAAHLAPYLPGHPLVKTGGDKAITAVSAAPFGSASILLISYIYIRLLGAEGLTQATRAAILNANYIKAKLEPYYPVVYTGARGRVGHELIFDLRQVQKETGVTVEDVAKRLMDYGFHAPTVAFPVHGTLMVEPTESEPKEELDRFCEAMIAIRQEIDEIRAGKADAADNVLKNAPHTAEEAVSENWSHPYSREKAVYPLPTVKKHKFWTPTARIDNTYGDRNVFCACPPMDAYR
ncbi:MAG: aminomethyl-transferring glycine dehydrogenase [candidate division KSB1 bacterium]|nr:aminomethyl-transferring glycine dehydrogenase [candidate division KSB1 bacterium]